MSWYDCIEPFVLNAPPGFNDRPIGVFSTFFPARAAQLEMNGKVRLRPGVGRDARRPPGQQRHAGVVRDLGEAARIAECTVSGRLDGKVAIVTGGGSGIGRASALTFLPKAPGWSSAT